MAFEYRSEHSNSLTQSQEDLLETIENLPFPFGGISKLKDLRTRIKLDVYITDRKEMLDAWKHYIEHFYDPQNAFRKEEHFKACNDHQGEIGFRRDFAKNQIRELTNPRDGYLPLLGLYSRTFNWWTKKQIPKVALIKDSIADYSSRSKADEDNVFGFVFIQEMMHAYFDAFNSEGYPSMEPLEEAFAEFAMLSFVSKSPSIRSKLFIDAKDYVISRIGKEPRGYGFGFELFERAGVDTEWMIQRYREISNWTVPLDIKYKYGNKYLDSQRNYCLDYSEENADNYFEYVMGVLKIDWKRPIDPIQPAIGEP